VPQIVGHNSNTWLLDGPNKSKGSETLTLPPTNLVRIQMTQGNAGARAVLMRVDAPELTASRKPFLSKGVVAEGGTFCTALSLIPGWPHRAPPAGLEPAPPVPEAHSDYPGCLAHHR
jgi:hypothetical protein